MLTNRTIGILVLLLYCLFAFAAPGPPNDTSAGDAALSANLRCTTISAPGTDGSPPLLLAKRYEEGIDLTDYWVSEKFDGVRAYWDGTRLISRGGHPIKTPDGFTADFPPVALDGELWIARGRFDEVSGTVRQQTPDPNAWAEVRYLVFDLPCSADSFGQRLAALRRLLEPAPGAHIALVEQTRIATHEQLMARLDEVAAAGGEGLMLHRDGSHYRAGRSNDLLKVKPYLDAEARVIAHLPGKGKYTGMLGSLLVEEPDGTRFRIGTGFSDAERRNPPPVGSIITFKYHGRTSGGLPRFASFLRIRSGT